MNSIFYSPIKQNQIQSLSKTISNNKQQRFYISNIKSNIEKKEPNSYKKENFNTINYSSNTFNEKSFEESKFDNERKISKISEGSIDNKQVLIKFEDSFIKANSKSEEDILLRYIPIQKEREKEMPTSQSLNQTVFLKKKSKLEMEIEKQKEIEKERKNNLIKESKVINNSEGSKLVEEKMKNKVDLGGYVSFEDSLIKKKSKLEIEKEKFKELMMKQKEESYKNKLKLEGNDKDKVLKIEIGLNDEEKFVKVNPKLIQEKTFQCQMCMDMGNQNKGKVFLKCGHYFHNKCVLKLKCIERLNCQACKKKYEESNENEE